jgi:flagellar biosynthesis protein FlhA
MHVNRSQEVAARFCLDRMNQQLFDIDQKIARKEITEDEGEFQKKRVAEKVDLYSCMDGSAKFLMGTLTAFTILYVVAVGGGVAVGILDRNMHWKDALNQYVMLSSGYLVLFVIPLFLTSLGFKTKLGD